MLYLYHEVKRVKDKTLKQTNFELLRIISMLLIIIYHFIYHGKIIEHCTNEGLVLVFTLLEFFTIMHVNCFVLITGYFQSKTKFKQSKVWYLINASTFYRIIIAIVLTVFGYLSLSKVELLKEFFILNIDQYWFIKVYLFLYCLSPFLNKFIASLDKKYYQKLLLVLFVLFSLIPYFTGNQAFDNTGYTLYNFIFLYFIGAYLRKYPISKSYLFRRCSKNLLRIILAFIFICCIINNYLISRTSMSLLNANSLINEVASNFINMSIKYSNPLVIIQAISFFLLFETFTIKSKIINRIAKLTLGVYMIHDNKYLRNILYEVLAININPVTSYSFVFYVIIVALGTFLACALIEYIRQIIFKFIYNRKVAVKIRGKYYGWLNSLKIE